MLCFPGREWGGGGRPSTAGTGLHDFLFEPPDVPQQRAPQTQPHSMKGFGVREEGLLLLSLQREVKVEPGLPGDHSDFSHHSSLSGTEDGWPCPGAGGGTSMSPPQQCFSEGGGPGPGHFMSLGEKVTVPGPSGLLPPSTPLWRGRAPSPSTGAPKGVLCMTLLPSASCQQAAVLRQGRGLFHPVPDPGSIVEPVRRSQQSELPWPRPLLAWHWPWLGGKSGLM